MLLRRCRVMIVTSALVGANRSPMLNSLRVSFDTSSCPIATSSRCCRLRKRKDAKKVNVQNGKVGLAAVGEIDLQVNNQYFSEFVN